MLLLSIDSIAHNCTKIDNKKKTKNAHILDTFMLIDRYILLKPMSRDRLGCHVIFLAVNESLGCDV